MAQLGFDFAMAAAEVRDDMRDGQAVEDEAREAAAELETEAMQRFWDEEACQNDVRRLERVYRAALTYESALIAKLPKNAKPRSLAACWRATERTNAAYRALQEARGE